LPKPKPKKRTNNPLDQILSEFTQKHLGSRTDDLKDKELFDFLVAASPHYQAPHHLAPIVPYLEALEKAPGFFAFSAPPRHGKSVLTNHWVARCMLRKPGFKVAYGCYSLDLSAGFFSDEVKDILTSNGIAVNRNKNSKEYWELENGSSFKAVAPGSGFTGRGADLIIIDDPFKGRTEAESGKIRDATWSWFVSVAITRRSPSASVLITHTRWHSDDVIGLCSRLERPQVPYLNLTAFDDSGNALWPEQWPADRLEEIHAMLGEYQWSSLYMGNPIPRGGAVFGDPTIYKSDVKFAKIVIGIDCAYTKKTHSDYSCAVVLGIDDEKRAYVLEVVRKQCEAPEFCDELKKLRDRWDSPPIYWYASGIEKGFGDFFKTRGIPVKVVNAKDDKFMRAQEVAAAWNAERVMVPPTGPKWLPAFLSEVLSFTGLDDPHDDQVDALAAAFIPNARPKLPRGNVQSPILPF
jgi:predicted phage terminase large subunit-like protein